MKLRDVLDGKGSASKDGHGPISVRPDKPVVTLPTKLAEQNIGSVLAIGACDHLHGIVTAPPYLAARARHGHRSADLKTAEIVQSPAPTTKPCAA